MGLWAYVSEQRKKQVIGIARSQIGAAEEVVCWARAKQPLGRKSGFVYVTHARLIVYWAGEPEGHSVIPWKDIRSWGADTSLRGGPVVGLETQGETVLVQMPARTTPAAASARDIIRAIAERAPRGARSLNHDAHGLLERQHPHVEVSREQRSLAGHTKRIVVTLIGLVMVLGGIAITPIPGPWSFPIILAGLAVLASEYDIADDVLQWLKERYHRTKMMVKARRRSRSR